MTIKSLPSIVIRGRSLMALTISPESPLEDWCAALDQQMSKSAGFFAGRPVVANLAAMIGAAETPQDALDALGKRGLSVIGVEGIDPGLLQGTGWEGLIQFAQGRDVNREPNGDRLIALPDEVQPAPAALSNLLIDRPIRSGQSIIFEDGDVTVIGSVASGAEIIAGGSIHIYGALRGRAIAGLRTGAAARIFCNKLRAELVAIDGLYHTQDDWGDDALQDRAVQIRLEHGALKISALA